MERTLEAAFRRVGLFARHTRVSSSCWPCSSWRARPVACTTFKWRPTPSSCGRQGKVHATQQRLFDSHFRPFYRTTQLIVRNNDPEPWTHDTFYDTIQYSSLFKMDFLDEVLDLQQRITSVQGNSLNRTIRF